MLYQRAVSQKGDLFFFFFTEINSEFVTAVNKKIHTFAETNSYLQIARIEHR